MNEEVNEFDMGAEEENLELDDLNLENLDKD